MQADRPQQDLIIFDGNCVFCSKFAQFIVRHDKAMQFGFVTAQSETGCALYRTHGLDPDLMETNIVIIDGRAHVKMKALAAVLSAIGWPWRAVALVGWIPRPISDWIYDRIANNRTRFGRRDCPLPSPELKARLIE